MRLLVLLILAGSLAAQTVYELPLWSGKKYVWVTLGPGLKVTNGVIDAVIPPATTSRRVYSVVLALSGGNYPLPAGATNAAVFLNGIRLAPGVDYQLLAGTVAPLGPWALSSIVLVDYDAP